MFRVKWTRNKIRKHNIVKHGINKLDFPSPPLFDVAETVSALGVGGVLFKSFLSDFSIVGETLHHSTCVWQTKTDIPNIVGAIILSIQGTTKRLKYNFLPLIFQHGIT